jgi:plasmid stability protein
MPVQTLTVDIPDTIYRRLERRARDTQRTVEAEVLDVLATAIPTEELPEDLAQAVAQLAFLDDAALWAAARNRLAADTAARLEELHQKRQREGLTESESQALAALVRLYERTLLIRVEAAALLRQRGHDVTDLAATA